MVSDRVIYIFRRRIDIFFSIEQIFEAVGKFIEKRSQIQYWSAPTPSISLKSLIALRKLVRQNPRTLYHLTGEAYYLALALPSNRYIVTYHDFRFLDEARGFRKWMLTWLYLRVAAGRAHTITCISEATSEYISKVMPSVRKKLYVVPNPVADHIRFHERPFNSQTPTLLFIGSTPNKNLERVIEALKTIPCKLLIIAKLTDAQRQQLDQHGIRFQEKSSLSQEEMNTCYEMADIVLFPSTYEGFGLPILEGFKAGRVVITSNIRPMCDVAEGAACLVDPYQVESISQGIQKVISDADYRAELIKRGRQVVQTYSLERVSGRYMEIYGQAGLKFRDTEIK